MLLQLDHVKKHYLAPSGEGFIKVLEDITFELGESNSIAIVGPSGSGKSTLLNLIATLDTPTSGTIHFHGKEITKLSEKEKAFFRNQRIGLIFQLHHLLPQCSVLENVLVPTLPRGNMKATDRIRERAYSLLKQVGLEDRIRHYPSQLSGGELQRVAFVRALINKPALILADEPTGSLDNKTALKLASLLCELNRTEGITLITVTHSITIAEKMKQILWLKGGILSKQNK